MSRLLGTVYKVQITCTHQVVITFFSVREDARHGISKELDDMRNTLGKTEFVTFYDVFGNTVAVDASQVIAVLVQVVDDKDELDAVTEKLARGMADKGA